MTLKDKLRTALRETAGEIPDDRRRRCASARSRSAGTHARQRSG